MTPKTTKASAAAPAAPSLASALTSPTQGEAPQLNPEVQSLVDDAVDRITKVLRALMVTTLSNESIGNRAFVLSDPLSILVGQNGAGNLRSFVEKSGLLPRIAKTRDIVNAGARSLYNQHRNSVFAGSEEDAAF